MIEEGNNIITDPSSVASAMNTFYANIAANIGRDQNPPTFNYLRVTLSLLKVFLRGPSWAPCFLTSF